MKRIIVLILLALLPVFAFCQVYKIRTTDFAYKEKNNGTWSEWSEWESSEMLVVLNITKKVLTII